MVFKKLSRKGFQLHQSSVDAAYFEANSTSDEVLMVAIFAVLCVQNAAISKKKDVLIKNTIVSHTKQ